METPGKVFKKFGRTEKFKSSVITEYLRFNYHKNKVLSIYCSWEMCLLKYSTCRCLKVHKCDSAQSDSCQSLSWNVSSYKYFGVQFDNNSKQKFEQINKNILWYNRVEQHNFLFNAIKPKVWIRRFIFLLYLGTS